MTWALEQAYAVINRVKERASEDEAFKRLTLYDPVQAIRSLTGKELPEGVELTAHEDEEGTLKLVVQGLQETTPTGEQDPEEAMLE